MLRCAVGDVEVPKQVERTEGADTTVNALEVAVTVMGLVQPPAGGSVGAPVGLLVGVFVGTLVGLDVGT
jgi:hypothetical protein